MATVAPSTLSKPAEPFITKVIPPKPPFGLVRRERLVRALARAVDRHRVAVVTAPAGYGKTSLIADFITDLSSTACWYSIDPEDNTPRAFLSFLVAAIRREFPGFGDGILHALNSASDVAPLLPNLIGVLVSEIQRIQDWFPLVLEDLHCCDDLDILNALDLLLRHLPENCFLVMSSRTRLPLGALSRLGAQRAITRLNKSDLAFRVAEVQELLQASGHHPDATSVSRLTADSEGWIAGIILLAPWLDHPTFEAALSTKPDQEELFIYLAEQVFDKLPERWRQLLIQSSVLPDVDTKICEQAFGFADAADLLRAMEESGLLINAIGDGGVYRYHALFREFLLQRAMRTPDVLREWHRAAAEYFATQGRYSEAVTFFLAARFPGEAVEVLRSCSSALYERGEWALLASLVVDIVNEGGEVGATLELWRARCLVQLGDPDAALALAEKPTAPGDPEDTLATAALREIVRSAALRSQGRVEQAMAAAKRALFIMERCEATPQVQLLRAESYHYLGSCLATAGRNLEAVSDLETALTLYEILGSQYHLATGRNHLGVVLYRLGNHEAAIASYEKAIEGCRRIGNTGALASALNNLGNLYISIGSFGLAQDVLHSALETARRCGNRRIEALATHSLGDSLAGAGHLEEAVAMLRRALTLSRQAGEVVLQVRVLLSLARSQAWLKSFNGAETALAQAERLITANPAPYNLGLLDYSRGLLDLLADDLPQAQRCLSDALELFQQSSDLRWQERTALLLAETVFRHNDLDTAEELLNTLREIAKSDVGPAALRPEARLSRNVLRFAADHLPDGCDFVRLCAAGTTAQAAGPSLEPKLRLVDKPVIKAFGLGSFSLKLNGAVVDESTGLTSKAKEVLFYLLTTGKRARREQLVEALWPDGETGKSSSVLRTNVYRLRKVLYDQCIVVRGDSYEIDPEGHFWFDLHYFKELLQRSRQANCSPVERLMLLESAMQLYRGPFLDEVTSDWCVAERYDMELRYASASLALASTYLETGDYLEAAGICERLLSVDAFNEDAILLLVRCHVALGDRATAMLHWRGFEHRLQTEAGTSPSRQAASQYEVLFRAS